MGRCQCFKIFHVQNCVTAPLQPPGNQIPVLNEHKCLGVIFYKKLSFTPHKTYSKTTFQNAFNLLKMDVLES